LQWRLFTASLVLSDIVMAGLAFRGVFMRFGYRCSFSKTSGPIMPFTSGWCS
jgi:hypothetical protein